MGPGHQGVARDLNSLARLYSSQAKYEEAEPLYERSLAIMENVFGADHPNTVTLRQDYVELLRATGRNDEADELAPSAYEVETDGP